MEQRREPHPDGEQFFRLSLQSGQGIRCTARQFGVDVILRILDPQGRLVAYMDLPQGPRGIDWVTVIAEEEGDHLLVISYSQPRSRSAYYTLSVTALESSRSQDRRFQVANRLLADAVAVREPSIETALSDSILDPLRKAAELWRRLDAPREELMTVSYLAQSLYHTGRLREAVAEYREAAELCPRLKEAGCSENLFTNLGQIHMQLGEPQQALDAFWEAHEHAESHGTWELQGSILSYLARLSAWLGDRDEARDRLREAAILRRDRRLSASLQDLQIQGRVYLDTQDYYHAALRLQEVVDRLRSGPRNAAYGTFLTNLGEAALGLGHQAQAEGLFRDALEVFEESGYAYGQSYALLRLGRALEEGQYFEEAEHHYQRALQVVEAQEDLRLHADILYRLARLQHLWGDYRGAVDRVAQAETLINELHSRPQTQQLQELGTASHKPIYELYVDVLMHLHDLEPEAGHGRRAFAVGERSRYRALLEMLHAARTPADEYAGHELLARRAELNRQIDRVLQRELTDPGGGEGSGELSRLRFEYQRLQQEILRRNPNYRRLADPESLTVKEVQERVLDEDSVLLEYTLGEERSFLWMVTRDDFRIVTLPGRERIEDLAAQTYSLLKAPVRVVEGEMPLEKQERLRRAKEDYPRVAGELSRLILGPVLEEVGDRRILVAAEGDLLYIPFAALPDPRHAGAEPIYEPLVIRNEVAHLPSASSVLQLRREPWHLPQDPRITLVLDPVYQPFDDRFEQPSSNPGGPVGASAGNTTRQAVPLETLSRLEGSGDEGRRIRDLGSEARFTVLEGFEATVQRTLDGSVEGEDLVHFAVHGLVDERHPELSGLALTRLAPDGRELDGFLSLHDIYNLQLRAQLVTLSACSTALGKEVRGEGLIGLTRGFLYAGVPRVVASLWQVDDEETADLMEKFYRHLLSERRRPAAALRQAQIEIRQQNKHNESPFSWAAFIVQGDWQ